MTKKQNLLFITYRFSGIQLKPIKITDWKCIINMAINIIINLIIFINFVILREFGWNTDPGELNQTYRNFNHFVSIATNSYAPLLWLFVTIYQYMNGKHIVRLLGQKSFQRIYHSKRHSMIVIVTMATFLGPYIYEQIEMIYDAQNPLKMAILQIKIYCVNLCYFLPLFLINYVKYATYQQMNQISRYSRQWRYKNRYRILQEFRNLACYNQMIAQILSPILITFFFIFIIDLLVIFYRLTTWLRNSIYLIMAIKYIVYIVYLDIQIERLFKQIINDYVVDISTSTTNVWQQNIERYRFSNGIDTN